jgi:hypothetical protein
MEYFGYFHRIQVRVSDFWCHGGIMVEIGATVIFLGWCKNE